MNTNIKSYSKSFYIFENFFKNELLKNRLKIYEIFKKNIFFNHKTKVLDVGTVSLLYNYENVFIHKYPYKKNISCLSNQVCKNLKKKYPDIKVYFGDGRKTFFKKNSFDIVHSNATIEHVGSLKSQLKFVKELVRISKKYIFISTPNRFYPFDLHTKYPFFHWLPKSLHRKILILFGDKFFSKEKNLNLLSTSNLIDICKKIKNIKYKFFYNKFFYFKSNIILIIIKS